MKHKTKESHLHDEHSDKSFHHNRIKPSRVLNGYDETIPLPLSVHALNQIRNSRKLDELDAEMAPLYPGYGTHFAYLYVGTPPQRQSVIVDTGSHYTAFPCTGDRRECECTYYAGIAT